MNEDWMKNITPQFWLIPKGQDGQVSALLKKSGRSCPIAPPVAQESFVRKTLVLGLARAAQRAGFFADQILSFWQFHY